MIDANPADKPAAGIRSDPDRSWMSLREKVREIIRAEVDKLHPTDDARRALELIIESSVRYADVDGALKITVVDKEGQSRTVERQGRTVDVTIHDLLDELRATHPILFKSPVQADAAATGAENPAPASPGKARVFPQESEKLQRDWLTISSRQATPAGGALPSRDSRIPFHLRRGKVRLHGWSRKGPRKLTRSAIPDEAAAFPYVPDRLTRSVDRAKDLVGDLREHSSSRPRSLAIGAAALVALFGIGAFALSGGDRSSSPQASADGPSETGAVARSTQTTSADASAASRGQTLRGVPDVIDTATLSLKGEVVRLFGVEWAPGGGKPEDLTRYLQGREVVCEPAGGNDTYQCQVGGQDLSRVVLFNGGGKPTDEATPELKTAADRAREAKIGVWSQQQ